MLRLALGALAARATILAARSTIATRSAIIAVAAIPARTTIVTAATAVTATVAAIAPVATIFPGLARGARVRPLLASLLVDQADRQADLAALVDLEQLDLDLLAFRENVADVLDPLVLDLRNVHQAVLAGHEGHECAEIGDARDLAGVDGTGLGLCDDALDPVARRLDLAQVRRRDLDRAVVVDVDLGASLRDDLANDLATGANDL